MAYTSNDLITSAKFLSRMDDLAALRRALEKILGTGSESVQTTLNDAGVTDAATPAAGGTITLTAMPATAPYSGIILIGSEQIRYRSYSGNVLTVQERGANNTTPAAHGNGSTVSLPASAGAIAALIAKVLLGDTSTTYGVGYTAAQVVSDLLTTDTAQKSAFLAKAILRSLAKPYFDALTGHISKIAPTVLTTAPSALTGTLSLTTIEDFARYYNDATSGTLFGCLIPEDAAYLFWLYNSGVPFNKAIVMPNRTQLASYAQGGGWTAGTALNRYNTADSTLAVYTQGFSAQAIQARCTVASAAETAAITASCEGMDGTTGDYFGRAASGGASGGSADSSTARRNFTGNLDMSAVGNTVALLNGATGDRAMQINTGASSVSGLTSGTFVIESVPDRVILAPWF